MQHQLNLLSMATGLASPTPVLGRGGHPTQDATLAVRVTPISRAGEPGEGGTGRIGPPHGPHTFKFLGDWGT